MNQDITGVQLNFLGTVEDVHKYIAGIQWQVHRSRMNAPQPRRKFDYRPQCSYDYIETVIASYSNNPSPSSLMCRDELN